MKKMVIFLVLNGFNFLYTMKYNEINFKPRSITEPRNQYEKQFDQASEAGDGDKMLHLYKMNPNLKKRLTEDLKNQKLATECKEKILRCMNEIELSQNNTRRAKL